MKFDAKILEDLAEWFEGLKEIKFSEILDATGKFERGAGADDGSHKKGGESNAVNQNERNLAANLKEKRSENLASGAANKFANIAFISVDMIEGFCSTGPLASPRVGAIADGIAQAFSAAYSAGARNLVLLEDSHEANCAEFDAFPPHAIKGTEGAKTIPQLRELPFFGEIKIFRKNSLSAAYCADFNAFIAQNPHIDTFVVLGDCTDLCVYQLVSHLKLSANEANIRRRVVVPASLVATYDAPGHEGDFYHAMFLRHMQTGLGAQVVRGIKF